MKAQEVRKEITDLRKWIEDNPAYIDGVIEKRNRIRMLEKQAQELEMAEWNL
jgi:hypothetical protein